MDFLFRYCKEREVKNMAPMLPMEEILERHVSNNGWKFYSVSHATTPFKHRQKAVPGPGKPLFKDGFD